MFNVSEEECDNLVEIIRNQFVDISKIISMVDPNKASDFKKRN
jgi:hypothetical protein